MIRIRISANANSVCTPKKYSVSSSMSAPEENTDREHDERHVQEEEGVKEPHVTRSFSRELGSWLLLQGGARAAEIANEYLKKR